MILSEVGVLKIMVSSSGLLQVIPSHLGVWGLGLRVWGLGFRVEGLGFGVKGLGMKKL